MALPEAAKQHYARQQRLSAATLIAARREWSRLGLGDFDAAWRTIGPRLLALLTASQAAAARDTTGYLRDVLLELEIDPAAVGRVNIAAFAGIASDGRDLDSLLYEPVIHTKYQVGQGSSVAEATKSGRSVLDRIVQTQLADAARAATGVGMVARPAVTRYVRMLQTPSCSRCAILAGRVYRLQNAFQRHPRCDCRHVPATTDIANDLTTDPRKAIEAGQVTGLSKGDMRAIDDGADINTIVNTRRGVQSASKGSTGRIRPDDIYRRAESREQAIAGLRRHGFIV